MAECQTKYRKSSGRHPEGLSLNPSWNKINIMDSAAPVPIVVPDLQITTRSATGSHSHTTIQYFSGTRSRHEFRRDHQPGRPFISITHHFPDGNIVFRLDPANRQYVSYETDQRGIMRATPVRPARRLEDSGGTLDIWFESIDTGERQEMFGQTARRIITHEKRVPGAGATSNYSESETEGWYIDYSLFPEWLRPGKNRTRCVLVGFSGKRDRIQFHSSGCEETGFALKNTTTTTIRYVDQQGKSQEIITTSHNEVIEFSQDALDPLLFEVPPDFRRVKDLQDDQLPRPSWWDRAKRLVGR